MKYRSRYLPYNYDSLTVEELFGDNTSKSTDKVTSAVNDYDFLEPHGCKSVRLVTIDVSIFGPLRDSVMDSFGASYSF